MADTYERLGKPKIPTWWLKRFDDALAAHEGNRTQLARDASDFIGRSHAWTGSAITKFQKGQAVTWDLALGLSNALNIPPPFFIARSQPEAGDMQAVARRYDSPTVVQQKAAPVKIVSVTRALTSRLNRDADQTTKVASKNEGSPRGLGHRRAPGSR